jgi:uncharacterized membrane protein
MGRLAAEPEFQLHTNRIEALSDGVFAIVMILLILEVHVPETSHGSLAAGLRDLWLKFLCYVIGFVTLGVYWVAHHLHFYTIKRADRGLLWINIIFLMCVGLVPFSTALLGEHYTDRAASVFFAANMILIGLTLYWHWAYATAGRRLVGDGTPLPLVAKVKQVILIGPAVYAAAILLAFVSPLISLALFALVNALYIIPGGIHLHLKHQPE